MSLQVWLPLNGDLHNQGLSDVTVTNNGATVDTAGKIGSCYSFDGSDDFISTMCSNYPTILSGNFSIALWFYNDDSGSRSVLFGDYGLTGAFKFNIEKTTGEKLRVYWNDGHPDWNSSKTILPVNTWSHIVVTKNEDTFYSYLNGTLVDSYTNVPSSTVPTTATTFYFGRDNRTGAIALKGKLNDLRIYDHCLSPKEVKELSKGLIAHYPLNDGVGGENIFRNTGFEDSNLTTYWNDEGGFGISIQDGELVIPYKSGNNRIYYNYQSYRLTANTDYVLSFDARASDDTQIDAGRWYTAPAHSIFNLTTKKKHYSHHINSSAGAVCFGWYGDSTHTANAIVYLSNIKLELGTKATPWIPNPNDALYSAMGLDNGICYDTSGYGHNSIGVSSLTINLDSPRYSCCYLFNGSNSWINIGRGAMVKDEITVNAWAYMDDWSTFAGKIISCTQGGGFNFENDSGKMTFQLGTGTSSNTYKGVISVKTLASFSSGWHMFTGTYNGLASKIYIDGVLDNTNNAYTTKTPIFYNATNSIFIGAEATADATTPSGYYFNGKLSDVRIYATALSAEDIKELYEVSASIDNTGNVYGSEVVE